MPLTVAFQRNSQQTDMVIEIDVNIVYLYLLPQPPFLAVYFPSTCFPPSFTFTTSLVPTQKQCTT